MPWGESGVSLGLCVVMHTPSKTLRVRLAGRELRRYPELPSAPLRGRDWRRMRVVHSQATRGLRVELDGHAIVERLELPDLAPAPHWRFGVGARTGPNPSQRSERHDVRDFEILLGALVAPETLLPEVSLNGQQFTANASAPFTYYPDATLSVVTPSSGPTAGNTALVVSGSHLHDHVTAM